MGVGRRLLWIDDWLFRLWWWITLVPSSTLTHAIVEEARVAVGRRHAGWEQRLKQKKIRLEWMGGRPSRHRRQSTGANTMEARCREHALDDLLDANREGVDVKNRNLGRGVSLGAVGGRAWIDELC